jgi:16S rRNA G1207 methylase RsmC
LFETATGTYDLQRYPSRRDEALLAWSAADALLVDRLHARGMALEDILVVNDDQGALSAALHPAAIWTDSALSSIAIEQNLKRNGLTAISTKPGVKPPAGEFAVVAMKVPKQLPLFQYQLALLARTCAPGTAFMVAGMDKHLSPKVASMLERYIGPTERHRGQKKARTFLATRDERAAMDSPGNAEYFCEVLGRKLVSLPNVFSREKVDMGSLFFIEQLAGLAPVAHMIDLACGNGILGLVALESGLCKTVSFCDESAMAVESARLNASGHTDRTTSLYLGDGLLAYSGVRADRIVCNPPFHSNHIVEEYVGRRLLAQCAHHLGSGGELYLVANRHLQYLPTLKRGFSRVEKMAENSKFIIWRAQK